MINNKYVLATREFGVKKYLAEKPTFGYTAVESKNDAKVFDTEEELVTVKVRLLNSPDFFMEHAY